MTSIFVGCINNDTDLSVPGEVNSDIPNTFDFATTESVQLNVNYDVPEGYKVLLRFILKIRLLLMPKDKL